MTTPTERLEASRPRREAAADRHACEVAQYTEEKVRPAVMRIRDKLLRHNTTSDPDDIIDDVVSAIVLFNDTDAYRITKYLEDRCGWVGSKKLVDILSEIRVNPSIAAGTGHDNHRRPCKEMTAEELSAEDAELDNLWKGRTDSDGHSGSPGEWIVERSDEIATELKRRDVDVCAGLQGARIAGDAKVSSLFQQKRSV